MAADLIKVFAISKTFAILICINTKLRCIEDCGLLWIKQTDGPVLCFEDQKNEQKWTKISGGSPKQVPSLGVFDDYLWLFVIIYDYLLL